MPEPSVINELFELIQRVGAKKEEAYALEIQALLMKLATSQQESAEYNALIKDLRNGVRLLKDIQIMDDGAVRVLAKASASASVEDLQAGDVMPCNPMMAENIAKSKKGVTSAA